MEEPTPTGLYGVLLLQCHQSWGILGRREGSCSTNWTIYLQVGWICGLALSESCKETFDTFGGPFVTSGWNENKTSYWMSYSTHREYRPRENVSFLENGTKIYALNPKSFVFVPEKSVGNPELDIVRIVNIPFVVRYFLTSLMDALSSQPCCDVKHPLITKLPVLWFIANQNFFFQCEWLPPSLLFLCPQAVMNKLSTYSVLLRTVISMYIKSIGVDLFLTRTVHEVLWGFKDPLLTKLQSLRPEVDEYFGLMWKVSSHAVSTIGKQHRCPSSYQSNRQLKRQTREKTRIREVRFATCRSVVLYFLFILQPMHFCGSGSSLVILKAALFNNWNIAHGLTRF